MQSALVLQDGPDGGVALVAAGQWDGGDVEEEDGGGGEDEEEQAARRRKRSHGTPRRRSEGMGEW